MLVPVQSCIFNVRVDLDDKCPKKTRFLGEKW